MNILIVDDEKLQCTFMEQFLTKQGYTVLAALNGEEGLNLFVEHPVDMVILDHRMPGMNGDELLSRIKEINPLVPAIMITAFGEVSMAVKIMQLGAVDLLEKPVNLEELLGKIKDIEENLVVSSEALKVEEKLNLEELPVRIIGESPAMRQVLSVVLRVASSPWTVLVSGKTGTGKELISRLVHLLSPRKEDPFIELNCAAIPENLFESELFGHEKGSFTGAERRRRGVFELANGGSLFLDEVGELPIKVQAKLLRALQEKSITRVGGETGIPVDVRIIAATNRDLKAMVKAGQFREDLYFRLKVIEVELPPLSKRREDIPLLVDFFLEKYNKKELTFDSKAMGYLVKYTYPGNVRELEHIIQRTITLSRNSIIREDDLPAEVYQYRGEEGQDGDLNERLASLERQLIVNALKNNNWVQTKAAESLGISERVLRYKMEKAGINKSGSAPLERS